MFTTLEIELNGQVATIWMNRPDLHNAFDETLITELTAACMVLDDDADVRVVVLAGRGKSFSAGADLNWMKRAANNGLDDNLNDARALAHMLRTLAEMKKPTIARVQGAALGGGMGLAAACDIAVASTKAVFASTSRGVFSFFRQMSHKQRRELGSVHLLKPIILPAVTILKQIDE